MSARRHPGAAQRIASNSSVVSRRPGNEGVARVAADQTDAARTGARLRRLLPSLMVLGAILAFAALWTCGAHDLYFALFRWGGGIPAYQFPFLDTQTVLAAVDCHGRGFDVYAASPCDPTGPMHAYPPLWFRLGALPIDASMAPQVGLVLALAFAASLALLPPGRSAGATAAICAAALSPPVAFAVERGNADVLLFVFAALAGTLAWRRLPTRLLAFPIIVLAALLKVYPATLLLLALRERRGLALAIGGAGAAVLLAYAVVAAPELREMMAVVPHSSWPYIRRFGLSDLPEGLAVHFGWSHATIRPVEAAMLGAAMLLAVRHAGRLRAASAALTPAETSGLLIGACLMVGCMVAGQSIEYRAIQLLFVFPGLTALAVAPGRARTLARWMVCIMLLQMWGDVVSARLMAVAYHGDAHQAAARHAFMAVWLARELAWWWLTGLLMAVLAALLPMGWLRWPVAAGGGQSAASAWRAGTSGSNGLISSARPGDLTSRLLADTACQVPWSSSVGSDTTTKPFSTAR